MNAPLRFGCPADGCESREFTAHGMMYVGQVAEVRKLRCVECGAEIEQGEPMLAIADDAGEQVATDGGDRA